MSEKTNAQVALECSTQARANREYPPSVYDLTDLADKLLKWLNANTPPTSSVDLEK